MYDCHLHIYLAGRPCRAFEVIKEMPALEHFTHVFSESGELVETLASEADVIVADLSDMDMSKAMQILALDKSGETQVILLADKDQIPFLLKVAAVAKIRDIWI